MIRFDAELVAGAEAPYDTWTFVIVPDAHFDELGSKRPAVRGTIGGAPFRETIHRAGGLPRLLVRRELLERIGAARGDVVAVTLELDPEPRTFEVPAELQAVLDEDDELAEPYGNATRSMRRAWATYVDEAKREDTRLRRAAKAPQGIRGKLYPNQCK